MLEFVRKKWHRKCTPCREDIKTKWREPTINWICGAYQTARRSFKSACSMRLRNCQDGTSEFIRATSLYKTQYAVDLQHYYIYSQYFLCLSL